MTEEVNDKLCPFCHTDNQCGINECETCWCFNVKVPQEMMTLVPELSKNKSCICYSCIEKFKLDRSKFIKTFVAASKMG